jgi:hypothetical protein
MSYGQVLAPVSSRCRHTSARLSRTRGAGSGELPSAGHCPRLQVIALFAQLSTQPFEQLRQTCGITVSAARHLLAVDGSASAVDDGQAQLAVTVLGCPSDALEGGNGAAGDQKCFVDTERGVHGVVSLIDQVMEALSRRDAVLVLMPAVAKGVTAFKAN